MCKLPWGPQPSDRAGSKPLEAQDTLSRKAPLRPGLLVPGPSGGIPTYRPGPHTPATQPQSPAGPSRCAIAFQPPCLCPRGSPRQHPQECLRQPGLVCTVREDFLFLALLVSSSAAELRMTLYSKDTSSLLRIPRIHKCIKSNSAFPLTSPPPPNSAPQRRPLWVVCCVSLDAFRHVKRYI